MLFEEDYDREYHRITPAYACGAIPDDAAWIVGIPSVRYDSLQRIGDVTASLVTMVPGAGDIRRQCEVCGAQQVASGYAHRYAFITDTHTKYVYLCMNCREFCRIQLGFAATRDGMLHTVVDADKSTKVATFNITTGAAPVVRDVLWHNGRSDINPCDRPTTASSPGGGVFHSRGRIDYNNDSWSLCLCDLLSENPKYCKIYACEYTSPTWSVCMRDNNTCGIAVATRGCVMESVDLRSGHAIQLHKVSYTPRWSQAAFVSDNLCVILDSDPRETAVDMRMPGVVIYCVRRLNCRQIA
jgi:hypothetical protein